MLRREVMTVGVKLVPLSESIERGRPHRLKTWFSSRTAVVTAVSFGAGRHSTHLVKLYVIVSMYVFALADFGTGPIQSICRWDQGVVLGVLRLACTCLSASRVVW